MTSYRTPMSRAKGLGAAKHGVGHWIAERVSAVALVPLVLWAVFAGIRLAATDYDGAIAWVRSSPVNPVLLTLMIAIGFWHMQAGVRVIIEDYLHKPSTKVAALLLNLFVCTLMGALAIFSILKVALGGA